MTKKQWPLTSERLEAREGKGRDSGEGGEEAVGRYMSSCSISTWNVSCSLVTEKSRSEVAKEEGRSQARQGSCYEGVAARSRPSRLMSCTCHDNG